MDNVNIQEVPNETSTRHFGEEGTKKRFTFKKAIKYVVIAVAILIIYKVFFAESSIDIVKGSAFMNSYGNATSETFGDYFVDGRVSDNGYAISMSNVQWSSESNDIGTGDVVTLTYHRSMDTPGDDDLTKGAYKSLTSDITIRWFVADGDDTAQCVYYAVSCLDSIYNYDISGDEAQERLYDKMDDNSF